MSIKPAKTFLFSLPYPHTSTYFPRDSTTNCFSCTKPLKNREKHKSSSDFAVNFAQNTVVKPFRVTERGLMNREIPIIECFPEVFEQKTAKIRKKPQKIKRNVENIVKKHALGFASIENLDFFKHFYRL